MSLPPGIHAMISLRSIEPRIHEPRSSISLAFAYRPLPPSQPSPRGHSTPPMYYHRVSSGRPIGTKEAVVAKNPTTAVVAGELVPPSGGRRAVCGAATMFYS